MSESSFEAPSLETIAALLPGYDIEAFIAEGGMGAVYKGRQRSLDRDVAIKILPRELGADPAFRQSFETEARAMARLNHPNLISVFDSGEAGGLLYIVMEFVRGKSLFHSAHNRAIDPAQAVELVTGICRGLAHAHDNGIIHRDVKPANILLTPKREPKLGDFGLARQAGPASQGLSMGTPGYTAPEVTANPDNADRRSDIFAAGVILYELLTGRSPEPGCPPPSKISGADPALDVIWETATRPDPADRYPSASAMASALERCGSDAPDPPGGRRRGRKRRGASGVGTNWSLARNLVIIAMLIVAIAITWKEYKRVQADRTALNQQTAAKNAKPQPLPPPPLAVVPAPLPESDGPETPEIAPEPDLSPNPAAKPPVESPAQALVRLRDKLAAGKRDEMPPGTVTRGDSDFFLVTLPMSWTDAKRFARSFGGHLPVVASAEDLEWLAGRIDETGDRKRSSHWLGVSHSPDQGWQCEDASPWPLPAPPQGEGTRAAVGADGIAIAEPDSATHPFLIQWHRDGSDPTSLAEILMRTKESLATAALVFPPGTLSAGDRRVLVSRQAVTAARARELADLGGGHLFVPSDASEADWLEHQLEGKAAADGLWIGGHRDDLEWKWDTGESWTFARWASDCPSGEFTALAFVPGRGWRDADPAVPGSGFVIEWSQDPAPAASPDGDSPAELRDKAGELLAAHDKERQSDLADNTKAFVFRLDSWLRGNSKGDVLRFRPGVELIKSMIRMHRIPAKYPRSTGDPPRRYPERMIQIVEDALAKEKSIDDAFTAKAAVLRDAYVERLAAIRDADFERGQIDLARAHAAAIAAAADTNRWAESFEGVTRKIDTSLPLIKVISATYGTGGKDADVTARVAKLVEEDQRDFHVTPRDLGADPNPGWNKGLTIVFEIDGKKRRKSWGENSEVKLSTFGTK
ncbi:protein kinase domain-containing protein [Luteolibacter marinus]|uniref:protein kinase domain-containing protein n=1 Tax=Luteolibacter marinus TaxID=2776705 RepID=UPI00186667C0|nr:protein kinase [Luteolibacter marinus]